MEPWGRGELWQQWCGLQKGGGGCCGRKEAPWVAQGGWRYQKEARQQSWRLPGHAGVKADVFAVCMHVDMCPGLWCVCTCICLCMLWSHVHSWKPLLSCCVNEMCLLLTSGTKVLSLLSAFPLVHHQRKTVLLTWSVLKVSQVLGEQLPYIQ